MTEIKIIKRDGRKVSFDKQKIINAIMMAMKRGSGIVKPEIASKIAKSIEKYFNDYNTYPTVSQVEELVYNKLISFNQKETARAYEGYRAIHEFKRNNHPLDDSVMGLVNQTNIDVMTENSNKQAMLASTQRDLIAGEVSKYEARNKLLPTYLVQAHDEGIIKIHDLDYFMNPITNCELVPLKDMFEKGTVINKKLIEVPKSFQTAMTLATQIAAQIASFTYGGQTMSISHLAPYVRVSKEKHIKEIIEEGKEIGIIYNKQQLNKIAMKRLKKEIKDGVQTFNYQLSTMNSTNGQSPFLSLFMYLNEEPEYIEETAMLIKEFLRQRIKGMKNEYGVLATQTFPKLLFVLDKNNMFKSSKYYYLKKLAIKATAIRMNPDYISAKRMKEIYGHVFPCMGCRSFLFPAFDENGNVKFYGRGNLGVTTLNLPDIALTSERDMRLFWEILKNRMDNIVKPSLELRYEKLRGVKASVAPILWQHGVFSRLNPWDEILPAIDKAKFSLSIGYAGLYEAVKYMTGKSHTSEIGYMFAEQIMKYLRDTADTWKEETGLGFSVYGSPIESTTEWFSKKLKNKFGEITDITDKGWITNSYHIDIREKIDAFSKLEIEGKLQEYSTGGNVSYVEVYNMEKNLEALEQVVDFMYEHNVYAEINSESDVCGKCHFTGTMQNDSTTHKWICPNCGNDNQETLSVVRRSCGYLGETVWTEGRLLDIIHRVKHL